MVTAGTVSTLRQSGIPSGYPAEQEADVKVRFVDSTIELMADLDIPLLKAVGGADQFSADNTKFEWFLRDSWTDRDNLGAQLTAAGTTLTIDGSTAHRFSRGMVLKCEDELIWVSALASATTLTVVRGYAGTSDVTHVNGTEFRIVGFSEVEGTDFTLRGSALHTSAYNFFSIYKMAVSETWIQSQQSTYVRSGATMPEMMSDNIAQTWVAVEGQVIEGRRYAGSGVDDPSMSGGLRYFTTTANGAGEVDAAGAKLSGDMFMEALEARYMAVGQMNMGRTVLCGIGPQRTLYREFIEPYQRTDWGQTAGPNRQFTRMQTEYGELTLIGPYKRIEADEVWIVDTAGVEVGTYGTIGRLHEGELTTQGDYAKKFIWGMYGNKIKRIPASARIHSFTTD